MRTMHYEILWRPGHVPALLVALLGAVGSLAWTDLRLPVRMGGVLPVDRRMAQWADVRVNPNTDSAASLRRLPGLGPVRAGAIVAYRRAASRPFTQPTDLEQVPGIGPMTAQRLEPYLYLPRGTD